VAIKARLPAIALGLTLAARGASAQLPATGVPGDHAAVIKQLSDALQWHGNEGHKAYLRIKNDVTTRLLTEVDAYVLETVSPDTIDTDRLSHELDKLLGHVGLDDTRGSVVLRVNLPAGRFLLVVVEVSRDGGAISEDAISFRAYKETGNRYLFLTASDFSHPADPGVADFEPVVSMNVRALASQPVASEFWFAAWADIPPRSPYTIAMRLYGFNGESFRVVWTADDFIAPYSPTRAVRITNDGGFILSRMPDFQASIVINEQFAVTADGPIKVGESEADRR
jgi:hypothetical protein